MSTLPSASDCDNGPTDRAIARSGEGWTISRGPQLESITRQKDKFVVRFSRDDATHTDVVASGRDLESYTRLQHRCITYGGFVWRDDEVEAATKAADRRRAWLDLIDFALKQGAGA